MGIPLADTHRAIRAADVNGDGRDDLIFIGPTIQVYLSLGGGLQERIDTRIYPGLPSQWRQHRYVWKTVELGDSTGDGLITWSRWRTTIYGSRNCRSARTMTC